MLDLARLEAARRTSEPVLAIDHLNVVYPDVNAVDDVSLSVHASEIVGLVGQSGSGKSSLVLAASRLLEASSSELRLLGRDFGRMRGRTLRRQRSDIQLVFQDPHAALDPLQTVRSGLEELRGLNPERAGSSAFEDLLGTVGLPADVLDRIPRQLSGGQAQRVVIARALLFRPKLLLADEPTSALDVSVQAQILNLLSGLRDQEGIAILFVSHDLAIVRHICDYVYVMLRGAIVEQGSTDEVLDAPEHPYTQKLIRTVPGRDVILSR